jgi:hypothetical protein
VPRSHPRRSQLTLSPLEARDVPSATTLDLTHRGSEVEAAGAIFQHSSGRGRTDTFAAIKGHGTEQGYNTDARPLEFDEKSNRRSTHSLSLSKVPVVQVDGVAYREFVLNIDQRFWDPKLTLTDLRVYLSNSKDLHGYNSATKQLGGLDAVYNLDADGNVSVKMKAQWNSWRGDWDVKVLIPDSAFAGQSANANVYLFSKFSGGNGGAEEWGVRKVPCEPPEPPTEVILGSLSGAVYYDANGDGTRTANSPGNYFDEFGIAGVVVTLTGTNDLGESVSLTTTTDDNGLYAFTGLRPGIYALEETQAEGFADWYDNAGSLEGDTGELGEDRIYNIDLTGANRDGTDYNFGETAMSSGT